MDTQTNAAFSREFLIGQQLADENPLPVTRPEGGTKLDRTWPDGVGKSSDDQPALPSRQPIATPKDVTPRRKK